MAAGDKLTAQRLAQVMHEELERHFWGDIEPHLFKMVAEGIDADDDSANDARDLEELLVRVVTRLRDEQE